MYNDDRVGMANHGSLTGLMLASTYNDGVHPEYGLVFVQGPTTSSYNVWSISPDGPAKGNSLNLHYGAQNTNIHSPSKRKFEFDGDGDFNIIDGNVKVASGHGIDFSATANTSATGASMSNELLDDYEEGSWAPTGFCDGGSVSVTSATYTKIGRVVYIYLYIASINIPNTACEWKMYGLPFNVKSGSHYPPLTVGYSHDGNLPAEIRFLFRTNSNIIYSHTTAGSSGTLSNQGMIPYLQGKQLVLSGFYFTD